MKRKKMLGTFMLLVPLMIVGCNKEEMQGEDTVKVESTKEDSGLNLKFSGKEKYKEIKIKIPKDLNKVEVKDDILLYTIGDSKRNIGISSDYIGEQELDEYIDSVKTVLGKTIDMMNSKQGYIKMDQVEVNTLEYNYLLNEKSYIVYQMCFKYEDLAYILTLWSDEENIEEDKVIAEQMIKSIFN